MKKDFIYFFRQVDLLRFNYLSPSNILATTMLLYTKRQIKYKLYINTFLFSSLFGSFSFFVSFCVQFTTFFHQQCKNNDEFNIDSTNANPFSVLVILPH